MYHIIPDSTKSHLAICGKCYRQSLNSFYYCSHCGHVMVNSWDTIIKGGKQTTWITPQSFADLEEVVREDSSEIKLEKKDFKSVLTTMVGGSHYQPDGTIQPIEFYKANPQLDFQQTNVIKYIYRFKDKNGLQDLMKVIHYTLIAAEFGYEKNDVDEFKQKIIDMLK